MTFNGLVYDLEIIKAIPPKDGTLDGAVEYCEGWHDHENMGISVIGAYDYVDDRYRVFCKDNFDEFSELASARQHLVSFNGIGFDNKVLRANDLEPPGVSFDVLAYDILAEMWSAAGLDPKNFDFHTHAGYGLDDTCSVNLGKKKTGHGALAPVDWQYGSIGSVIDYCLEDVRLTRFLMDRILTMQFLVSPKKRSEILWLSNPWEES